MHLHQWDHWREPIPLHMATQLLSVNKTSLTVQVVLRSLLRDDDTNRMVYLVPTHRLKFDRPNTQLLYTSHKLVKAQSE